MSNDHDAIIAEADEIARQVGAILRGKRSVALFLALGEILGAQEIASAKPNRQATLRLIAEGMNHYIASNLDAAAARKLIGESKIEQAANISAGACDLCPAIHINFLDADGDCFATASVPIANAEPFIKQVRDAMGIIGKRHSAPSRRQ